MAGFRTPDLPSSIPFELDERKKLTAEPVSAPFVLTAAELKAGAMFEIDRRYKRPSLTRVGPVRSGSLREFEEEDR